MKKAAFFYFTADTSMSYGSDFMYVLYNLAWESDPWSVMHGDPFFGDNELKTRTLVESIFGKSNTDAISGFSTSAFKYEPWSSAIEMLAGWLDAGIWTEFISPLGPEIHLNGYFSAPAEKADVLSWLSDVRGSPSGWARWGVGLEAVISSALQYSGESEVFVVSRGPVLGYHRREHLRMVIDWARWSGLKINVVPMGNSPDRRLFPNIHDLAYLASRTGGRVYYLDELPDDPFDFSYLPEMVDQMVEDFGE